MFTQASTAELRPIGAANRTGLNFRRPGLISVLRCFTVALLSEDGMTRIAAAFVGTAIILAGVTTGVSGLHAAPPTVVPSPGYDARLRESRPAPTVAPLPYEARPSAYSRHRKRLHRHHRGW
ncbi:MAG: hypothetical protein ABW175_18595 [Bradyrhizobium sp.]